MFSEMKLLVTAGTPGRIFDCFRWVFTNIPFWFVVERGEDESHMYYEASEVVDDMDDYFNCFRWIFRSFLHWITSKKVLIINHHSREFASDWLLSVVKSFMLPVRLLVTERNISIVWVRNWDFVVAFSQLSAYAPLIKQILRLMNFRRPRVTVNMNLQKGEPETEMFSM